ncbi:MAG: methyltransferase domain-containing protein [Bacteroidota bacterium]
MQINKVFDEWSAAYTEKMTRWVPFYLEAVAALYSGVPEWFNPDSILDLGCGNGNAFNLFLHHYPNAQFTLLDASEEMINLCKTRFSRYSNISYQQTLFQETAFQSASFDLITASYSLHHLRGDEKAQIFKKIFKWLKPNGILTLCDLHIGRTEKTLYHAFLKTWEHDARKAGTPDEEWEYLMDHHMTYDFPDSFENTRQWLLDAGFSEVNISWQEGYWMTLLVQKPS